eukprot:1163285-Pyramimonas_sp.AAC.1
MGEELDSKDKTMSAALVKCPLCNERIAKLTHATLRCRSMYKTSVVDARAAVSQWRDAHPFAKVTGASAVSTRAAPNRQRAGHPSAKVTEGENAVSARVAPNRQRAAHLFANATEEENAASARVAPRPQE